MLLHAASAFFVCSIVLSSMVLVVLDGFWVRVRGTFATRFFKGPPFLLGSLDVHRPSTLAEIL